ncbi:hypothetical protein F4778DRAFT_787087 [Xylariomycetidae sp. FL2044]|nr:hypothetical protein F4778DRAFT_787087 [Xylariomycetidae sp. FL2044]
MDRSHLLPELPRRPRESSRERAAAADPGEHLTRASESPARFAMTPGNESRRPPRKLVLCFDGTGNKFRGDDSDSNILKIFRCLDREADDQCIGTYNAVSTTLSHTSVRARLNSWYQKAKDSAIGSSFDHHVVGGYRFLMRFYEPGDVLYLFGFSRGAYVARFLAEMLDYIGLLSHGNEELVSFAWKAFSRWQSRQANDSEESQAKRHEMYRFMKGFRETFSRPVKRIRFLGLFDTVNSVPRFETAWMQRSKFPYTARSSAKVIRHCVSIDERRAKFRQDLIYQGVSGPAEKHGADHSNHHHHHRHNKLHSKFNERYRARRSAVSGPASRDGPAAAAAAAARGRKVTLAPNNNEMVFRPHSRSRSRATTRESTDDRASRMNDGRSEVSQGMMDGEEEDSDDNDEQDIDELWFAGGHGDVGGGWDVEEGKKSASHIPLARDSCQRRFQIREAEKAGLNFDPEKLVAMGLSDVLDDADDDGALSDNNQNQESIPGIRIDPSTPTPLASHPVDGEKVEWGHFNNHGAPNGNEEKNNKKKKPGAFHQMIHQAHLAPIHDSLEFSSGLSKGQVISWKIMEYLPFRRMDLRSDGSWKPIRWPLPCGETRDCPHSIRVHGSVITRMKEDENYRPGNLIIGGGGRGIRVAPKEYGIGEWECVQSRGDPIEEVWVKKTPAPTES